MAVSFPQNPSEGDTFTSGNSTFAFTNGKWVSATSPDSLVSKSGDTMTGDLTVPNLTATSDVQGTKVTATNHMEGVYTTSGFIITGLATLDVADFDIPAWCNKIEIDFQDWHSKATGAGYIQLLDGGAAFNTNSDASRNFLTWGDGFSGVAKNPGDSQTQAIIYGIGVTLATGGSFVINMEDEYNSGGKWRCNYTGGGTYQTDSDLSGWAHYGQWLATGNDRPTRLRIASNNPFTSAACVGRVRFYA